MRRKTSRCERFSTCCSTCPSPFHKQVQSMGLHYERLRSLCQVCPHIRAWGLSISFSMPAYLCGEYLDDYGWDTASPAANLITLQLVVKPS